MRHLSRWRNLIPAHLAAIPETPISVLGSFTRITQHTGPTALRPIRRTKQLWLSVLLKYTSVTTGIRTHILLLTPESGKLDRSATTRHDTPTSTDVS